MSLISLGGAHWTPHLISWGTVGRPAAGAGRSREILGYSATSGVKGRMSEEERRRRRVDVWNCSAVYALFDRGRCLYVGEGKLGDRLESHWKSDALVGRWDSFTWLSPLEYRLEDGSEAELVPKAEGYSEALEAKGLLKLLELVAIRLGSPEANAQLPADSQNILWLTQLMSPNAKPSLEAKVDRALELLQKLDGG